MSDILNYPGKPAPYVGPLAQKLLANQKPVDPNASPDRISAPEALPIAGLINKNPQGANLPIYGSKDNATLTAPQGQGQDQFGERKGFWDYMVSNAPALKS